MTVTGDVYFGRNVTLRGTVIGELNLALVFSLSLPALLELRSTGALRRLSVNGLSTFAAYSCNLLCCVRYRDIGFFRFRRWSVAELAGLSQSWPTRASASTSRTAVFSRTVSAQLPRTDTNPLIILPCDATVFANGRMNELRMLSGLLSGNLTMTVRPLVDPVRTGV